MALVEAARFHTLSEAHIAASVLRSAGIVASIADAHYGSVFWIEQRALGGYRLSVAEEDLADTIDILQSPPPVEPLDESLPEPLPTENRIAAGALALTLGPAAGWLATRRSLGTSLSERPSGALRAMLLIAGAGGLTVAGLYLAVRILAELLTNPP
jgi:hypothetical protein